MWSLEVDERDITEHCRSLTFKWVSQGKDYTWQSQKKSQINGMDENLIYKIRVSEFLREF